LLPNGNVVVAGGLNGSGALSSSENYNVGLGFNPSWQPQITSPISPVSPGISSLVLTGSQFRGVSEGSGGNSSQDSPADYPVVQLLGLGNEQTTFLLSTSWSSNSYTSATVGAFPPGYALVTVFVNGIPSTSGIVNILPTIVPTNNINFNITSIMRANANDLLITWSTSGSSNYVQVSGGAGASPSFPTNALQELTSIVVTSPTASFVDVGAFTNGPARYYRIRSTQ